MQIAHISDLHLKDLKGARPWHFLNQRVLGGANLLLNRSHHYKKEPIVAALTHIAKDPPDRLVITGDISNLAFRSEFEAVSRLLETYVPSIPISIIPGNHDAYIRSAVRQNIFASVFQNSIQCDLRLWEEEFPYVHLHRSVAFIGISTSVNSPPLFSYGKVDKGQLHRLTTLLRHQQITSRFKVVLMHHGLKTPDYSKFEFPRKLMNRKKLLNLFLKTKVNMVLHGHNHYYGCHHFPHLHGPGELIVCEAGSVAKVSDTNPKFKGKLNRYTIKQGLLRKLRTYAYEAHSNSFELWKSIDFNS